MSILLTILKVIGIVLLILLCILLTLVCCVLFVPIRYQTYIKKDETLQANLKVSYLLHIISVFFGYNDGKKSGKVKIFGITIHDFFPSEKKKKRLEEKEKTKEERRRKKEQKERTITKQQTLKKQKKEKQKSAKQKTATINVNNRVSNTNAAESPKKEIIKETNASSKKGESLKTTILPDESSIGLLEEKKKQGIFEHVKALKEKVVTFCKKIIDKVKNIKYTICNIFDKLQNIKETILFYHEILTREESKRAISKIKAQSGRLLKHIKPCNVKGIVEFGFDDPATTGDLFGKVCMFYPLYGNNIVIIPHFEEEIMKGELVIKGRIRIATLLNIAWKIIFDKEIRTLYKALTGGNKNE